MSVNYSLLFVNNSTNLGNACVYQTDPDIGVPNVMSLAWFSKTTAPTTKSRFTWTVDYDFVWSEVGVLEAGVLFEASQSWRADLSTTNRVGFTHEGGAYTFTNQSKGPKSGTLYIAQSASIPLKQAAVGIGMSGKGTFVVQSQPNLNLTFTPHPKYWITFGNYDQGEVLDIGAITNPAEIEFPPGVYSMTAILNKDNSWTVKPTSEVNKAFLRSRQENRMAQWGLQK
ncbi:hypothetical protein JQX13_04080 [Archangium violaceum]|uniref:hypothetical protein n=1 Tax=Archangium violaceum TaxID=83451 RepID=UPI00193B50A2|nr:hypothetical protein [Archangium violaceum]QRK09334.1 hypothetical protein JQX13_04080 [Archangium violaceum]